MEHAAHAASGLGPLATHAVSYLWLIPFFPLVGAVINATLGVPLQRKLGKGVVHGIGVGAMVASFMVAGVAFVSLLGLSPEHRFLQDTLWNAISVGNISVDLGFALGEAVEDDPLPVDPARVDHVDALAEGPP